MFRTIIIFIFWIYLIIRGLLWRLRAVLAGSMYELSFFEKNVFWASLSQKHNVAGFWNFTFISVFETSIQRNNTSNDSDDPHDKKVRSFFAA